MKCFDNNLKERLVILYDYNPITGIFLHKKKFGYKQGTIAGSPHKNGYLVLGIDRRSILAHRAAWAIVNGSLPDNGLDIDHIDGDKRNNSISNLRVASRSDNLKNSKGHKDSKSGVKGVSWCKRRNKWQVRIFRNGENKWIGMFEDINKAKEEYEKVARVIDGEFYKIT